MKNVLLVEPRSPDFNIFSIFKMPRMGLAVLGTLAKKAGYNVKIIYQEVTSLSFEHIVWADIVGFSITTSTAPEGYRLAHLVRIIDKQRDTHTPIIFGGVHATFEPEEALSNGDYVLRGEADDTFIPFLEAMRYKGDLSLIPALTYKIDDKVVNNAPPEKRTDMNTVPTPDMSLFEGYKPITGTVMTSRGCPFDCSFCSVTAMLGRKYRMRSIDLVMADLEAVHNKYVFFYDDHFAADKKRTKELLERIIEAQKNNTIEPRQFSAQVRSDIAKDPELLDLMKRAGFYTFFIGFESINPEALEIFNKKQTFSDIEYSIREIHKRGIQIHGMFIFGSDADDKETFRQTIRFSRKNKIESIQFLILTPLPGTPHYNNLEEQGRIVSHEWNRFDAHSVVFLPKKMTPYYLQIMTIKAMIRFYSPLRTLKYLVAGNIRLAFLGAYGWISLHLWRWHNRSWLKMMKTDHHTVFVPEFMKTNCQLSQTV
jgi:radical SAM superfamily enzyme YgiQ (UPF0313 family)